MDIIEFLPNSAAVDYFLSSTGIESGLDKGHLEGTIEDAVRKLRCSKLNKHRVALLQLQDNSIQLPPGLSKINHVAYRPLQDHRMSRKELHGHVSAYLQLAGGGKVQVNPDCNRCGNDPCSCKYPAVEIDLLNTTKELLPSLKMEAHGRHTAGYASTIDLPSQRHHHPHSKKYSPYHQGFRLIKPAQHSAFNADLHVRGCLNLDRQLVADSLVAYRIDSLYMYTNVPEGEILISYFGRPLDELGRSLVPNIPEMFEYIDLYLTAGYLKKRGMRTDNVGLLREATAQQQLADRKMEQVRGLIETPTFNEWWTFLENNFTRMVPYYESYQNWNRSEPDRARDFASSLHNY